MCQCDVPDSTWAFSKNRALWLNGAASHLIDTAWEPLEITEKSLDWQSMGLLLSTADKKPTSSIQHDQSYQVTETMASQFWSSFRKKKKEVMPEPTVLLSVIRNGTGKKRNKCKSSHCLKKRKRQPHTPLRTRTYTLPVHCVDSDKQEKAGPPDSAMMKLYFRISLFVLVGRVQVKCSS